MRVLPRQWERACFPAGVKGLTGCGEILDLSEMSSPPPLAMWDIWLLIMSLFPIVLLSLLHVRIHPSPTELIKELEMMLQLSAIAEILSESLVIWSAAGNHTPLTLFGLFCFFQVGVLAYCCLCSPGLLVSGWELSSCWAQVLVNLAAQLSLVQPQQQQHQQRPSLKVSGCAYPLAGA